MIFINLSVDSLIEQSVAKTHSKDWVGVTTYKRFAIVYMKSEIGAILVSCPFGSNPPPRTKF